MAIFLLISAGNIFADDFENLEKKIKNAKPNTEKVSLYAKIGAIIARNTAHGDSKLRYILQGIKLADEIEDYKGKVVLLNIMGTAKRNRGKFDEARKFHLKALEIARNKDLKNEEVAALNNLGVVWRRMDQLKQAAQYHNEALKIATEIGDTDAIAISCNGLGNINLTLKKYDVARGMFERALEMQLKIKSDLGVAINYNNLGVIAERMGKNDDAIEYYKKSLIYNKKISSTRGQAINYECMANIYREMGQNEKAISLYKKAIEINTLQSDAFYMCSVLVNLGHTYIHVGKLEEAERNLKQGLEMALKIKANTTIQLAYTQLSDLAVSRNDYRAAYNYQLKAREVEDEIMSSSNKELITELNARYEMATAEAEIANLEARQEHQTTIIIIIVAVAIILLILAVFMVIRVRRTRELVEKNRLISVNIESLKKQTDRMMEIDNTKNRLFSIIGHDLKNPLHSISFATDMLMNYSDLYNKEQLTRSYEGIAQAAKEMNEMFDNLLIWSRVQTGTVKSAIAPTNLALILTDSNLVAGALIGEKNIKFENKIPEDIEVMCDTNMLRAMVKNLMQNSIKFTDDVGTLTIDAVEMGDDVRICVADTGIGMSPELVNSIFNTTDSKVQINHAEPNTYLEMIISNEFVKHMDGKMWVESTLGAGSQIYFTLKNAKKVKKVKKDLVK